MTLPRHPLVLLHGFGASAAVWDPVQEHLQGKVYTPTYIGHVGGRQAEDPTQVTVADIVDSVAGELDEAGIGTAHLVGNSLGGWVALQLATRGYAASVTCLAPAGGWKPDSAFELRLLSKFIVAHWACARRNAGDPVASLIADRMLLRQMVHRPDLARPEAADRLLSDIGNCSLIGRHTLGQAGRNFNEPVEVAAPVTIAWPEHDLIFGRTAAQERFKRLVPAAEQVMIRGAGHIPMLDYPAAVAALINSRVQAAETEIPRVVPLSPRRLFKRLVT